MIDASNHCVSQSSKGRRSQHHLAIDESAVRVIPERRHDRVQNILYARNLCEQTISCCLCCLRVKERQTGAVGQIRANRAPGWNCWIHMRTGPRFLASLDHRAYGTLCARFARHPACGFSMQSLSHPVWFHTVLCRTCVRQWVARCNSDAGLQPIRATIGSLFELLHRDRAAPAYRGVVCNICCGAAHTPCQQCCQRYERPHGDPHC